MKKILALFGFLAFFFNFSYAQEIPDLILFYGETCPHCKQEEKYIETLKEKYDFNVIGYEVYYNADNQNLMEEYAEKFGTKFNAVPLVIMGEDYFLGESYEQTEDLLKKYAPEKIIPTTPNEQDNPGTDVKNENDDILSGVIGNLSGGDITGENSFDGTNMGTMSGVNQNLTIFGKEISLKNVGPVVFGILLGLVDGINPCMFGVLIFLLTYLVSIGSKKKVLYSGLIFILTTFVLYFLIMFLMHKLIFSTMFLLPYIAYIKIAIGVIAIILGLIEIKDFFWYGKGISLKIPASIKPTLEYITKKGTYMSAFILACLSTFVELPCTIGIPLAYVGAVGESMNIFRALLIYNFFFVIPLLFIVLGIYYGLSSFKEDEEGKLVINNINSKRIMRLIAGVVLILLGVLFILKVL